MGRPRRAPVRREPSKPESDGGEEPEPPATEIFPDEVDDFPEQQLATVMGALESEEEAESEEEVLGLQLPEESSDDEEEKDEEDEGEGDEELSMQSDLEEPDRGSRLPHELSWGQRKQLYYDTDYGADAHSKAKRSREEVEAEEEEEEQEAQVIQKRLVQNLGEDDYGLDLVQGYIAEQQKAQGQDKGQKIAKDLQMLSKKEQLKLLRQESPELLQLIGDFEAKLAELKDKLHPLIQMVKNGIIPQGKGSHYLETKYHLYLNYCANISFYLVLKSKRMPVHRHPVIERLVTYRNLINDLSIVDQKLSAEIELLLKEFPSEKEIAAGKKEPTLLLQRTACKTKPKTLRETSNGQAAAKELTDDSDFDEEAALKYYMEMEEKVKLKRKKRERQNTIEEPVLEEEEDPNKKRGVTYQMVKNKGLAPKRKKADRNPRVKHREKFRRAKIRRKGQVREVRREEQRYGGELSGIRAGVKKSRKLQ
ncbi:something about silencing protein 10 [Alligator mississippiensis]|uniref:Something about silencing protein 10 isoform A n=2 Tax=Alligator mississippiensis TaxID=8496 RepID=A0A151N5T1_ALLMI|nr:something about silencing protein 10 [Alligator mississippiensis]KYO31925.1 something about silencing protein 10 isoform A [Alligator mississippiensis]